MSVPFRIILPQQQSLFTIEARRSFDNQSLRLLNDFNVRSDVHGFAHEQAAVVERLVPFKPKVRAIDCAREFERADGLSPWAFRRAFEDHVKLNRFCYAVHGEVADQLIVVSNNFLERLAFECNGWIVGDIKEIGTAQVSVAFFIFGVDAGGINREGDFSIGEIIALRLNFTFKFFELTRRF